MTALVLALVASSVWGVADFVAGLASRRVSALLVLLGQQLTGAAIVVAILLVTGEDAPSDRTLLLSVLAGGATALALAALYRGLAVGTMSIVAPISATGVTLPIAVGFVAGERPSAVQAVGLVLAVCGVVLASRESEEAGAAADAGADASAAPRRRGIGLALLAALGFGLYYALADGAAEESVLWLLVVSRTVAVVILAVATAATRAFTRLAPRDLGTLALIGVLDLTATGLVAVATTQGLLAVVAVLSSLYPVVTVLLARFVLHERLARIQAIGVATAFVGVAAVAGGG